MSYKLQNHLIEGRKAMRLEGRRSSRDVTPFPGKLNAHEPATKDHLDSTWTFDAAFQNA
jgi:hypothetical protein